MNNIFRTNTKRGPFFQFPISDKLKINIWRIVLQYLGSINLYASWIESSWFIYLFTARFFVRRMHSFVNYAQKFIIIKIWQIQLCRANGTNANFMTTNLSLWPTRNERFFKIKPSGVLPLNTMQRSTLTIVDFGLVIHWSGLNWLNST